MLCSVRFHHELVHGTLTYCETADVAEVVNTYQLCPNAQEVLASDAYRSYFDKSLPQPNKSVITFRKIVNHDDGCPECTRRAQPQPLSCPPPAAMPPPCHQGRAALPQDVRDPAVLEQQVRDAEECIQNLRNTLDAIDDRKRKEELTTKIKECARRQNIAACCLEVASPLYLIFNMIIPVL